MRPIHKGLLLGALQLAIVSALGIKLQIDRVQRPRVWVRAVPSDPDLPIRGRYASLRLMVDSPGFQSRTGTYHQPSRLEVRGNRLIAVPDEFGAVYVSDGARFRTPDVPGTALLEPVVLFIPEHAEDPTIHSRIAGEELWVEATIPSRGPPRPIRLGLKKNGVLVPLQYD